MELPITSQPCSAEQIHTMTRPGHRTSKDVSKGLSVK